MPAKTEKDATIIEYAKTLAHTPWCDDYEKMISGVLYGRNCLCSQLDLLTIWDQIRRAGTRVSERPLPCKEVHA